jgi:hypothetical protein
MHTEIWWRCLSANWEARQTGHLDVTVYAREREKQTHEYMVVNWNELTLNLTSDWLFEPSDYSTRLLTN